METLFIGKNIIFLPEVSSTNSYATDLLRNIHSPEGTVIHTAHQTQGKGQRGNSWNAEPASNLTASIILRPTFLSIEKQFFLYQISALACYDTLAEFLHESHFDIKVKFPNDVLVNRKKIAGILIENNLQNSQIMWSVVGVGINVNQTHFAENIKATSLKLLQAEKQFEVSDVLKTLCKHLEKWYLALLNNKFDFIKENYLKHFFGLNVFLDFEINNEVKNLLVKGISEKGLLLLEDRTGRGFEFDVKGVKWVLE